MAGGPSHNSLQDILVDDNQHTFSVGHFLGTCDFDPSAQSQSYTSQGNADAYLARYDEVGNLVWAKTFGGSSTDYARGVVMDSQRNLYVVGCFSTSVDFDPGPGVESITSEGSYDIFLAKFDENGNFGWVKTFGATDLDWGEDIAIDAADNVYITGRYNRTVDFDPGPGTNSLQSYGSTDTYVAKYDANGNHLWGHHMGSVGAEMGNGITVDDSANVFICGYFHDHANFIPGSFTTQYTAFNKDIFLVKYDSSGAYRWVNGMGGPGTNCEAQSVHCDPMGNVVVTGLQWGIVDFDPTAGTANHSPNGGSDIWMAKYDLNGQYLWSNNIGGTANEFPLDLKHDSQGDIVITGYYEGTADFDPGPGNQSHTAMFANDVFLAKYDPNGDYLWSAAPRGNGFSERGTALAIDDSMGIYLGGALNDTLYFPTDTLYGAASSDMFIAYYQDSVPVSTNREIGEAYASPIAYPNPGKDQLYIKLSKGKATAATQLIDLQGNVVRSYTSHQEANFSLSLTGISAGLYVLSVETEGQVFRSLYRIE